MLIANRSTSQIAAGFVLGTFLGIPPFLNPHSLLVMLILVFARVSARGFLMGAVVTIPLGFVLDPVLDRVGAALLSSSMLEPIWQWAFNVPILPLTNFNNSVVLGGIVVTLFLAPPLFFGTKALLHGQRETWSRIMARLAFEGTVIARFGEWLGGNEKGGQGPLRLATVVPALGIVAATVIAWAWLADAAVKRGIEWSGTAMMGATVDVAEADIDLSEGRLRVRGLEVTDPARPTHNLVQFDELIADIRVAPLLEKKLIVDTVAALGIRLGTERTVPGEVIEQESSLIGERIRGIRSQVEIPEFSLDRLDDLASVPMVEPESLQTVAAAMTLKSRAANARDSVTTAVTALDPGPLVDSARTLTRAFDEFDLFRQGVGGARRLITSSVETVSELGARRDRLTAIGSDVAALGNQLQESVAGLDQLRDVDYEYALSLLPVPDLSRRDISPSLVADPLMRELDRFTSWFSLMDALAPGGFGLRRVERRALRAGGRDFTFPVVEDLPKFALGVMQGSLVYGAAADTTRYELNLTNLSSHPRLTGEPTRVLLNGVGAGVGSAVAAVIDRLGETPRDSVAATLTNLDVPRLDLGPLNSTLKLNRARSELTYVRDGQRFDLDWALSSAAPEWARSGELPGFVWNALNSLATIELGLGVSGSVDDPDLDVTSNIGPAVRDALRRQLGAEIAAARRRLRAQVDGLVAEPLRDARSEVNAYNAQANSLVEEYTSELESARTELEARIRALRSRVPGLN